ncbi:hypothetical protein C9374_006515 [Naegleria lovaniensis]|uniref:Uncharacterized protein n=1 Tax=Naegleria lovaniensis TaxID=51637 RepID=A0AA88GID5_NAELO|nr:uncharacterized protein C9374_006515 [Naegleria lovaniensis]KAG2381526.1 hypothetical protein C9374_006515 [Naegleria lovaniensis]
MKLLFVVVLALAVVWCMCAGHSVQAKRHDLEEQAYRSQDWSPKPLYNRLPKYVEEQEDWSLARFTHEETNELKERHKKHLNRVKQLIHSALEEVLEEESMDEEFEEVPMSDSARRRPCVPTGMFSFARLMGQQCRTGTGY